jgi:hypothetical protein
MNLVFERVDASFTRVATCDEKEGILNEKQYCVTMYMFYYKDGIVWGIDDINDDYVIVKIDEQHAQSHIDALCVCANVERMMIVD